MKLVDIAVNLTDGMFRGVYHQKPCHAVDVERVLERAWSAGVDRILITGTDETSSREAIALCSQYKGLYATVGLHPTCATQPTDWQVMKEWIQRHREHVVAVGECGLDYDREQFSPRAAQRPVFMHQLALSRELHLPLFLHNRNTQGDFVQCLRDHQQLYPDHVIRGVVHSYTDSLEEMREILSVSPHLYIGVNGCSLKTQENLNVVRDIPLDRLMLETDAPWCDIRPTHASYPYLKQSSYTPCEAKKKEKFELGRMVKGRNEPCMIRQVLAVVAALRGEAEQVVAEATYKNSLALFFPQ